MLKKLLKYEFKSVSRTLIPILLGTLAIAILTSVLFTINFRMIGSDSDIISTDGTEVVVNGGFANGIFAMILITLFILFTISIIASFFVVWFILMQRYYKNFFCDEGYLTFTLPVKTSQHLTSKLISGIVWTILGGLTVFLSVFLLIAFGTADSGIVNVEVLQEIWNIFGELYSYVGTGNGIAYTIEVIVLVLIELATQTLLFYLAITIGSIIAKKHKILASAGVYLGINSVAAMVINIGALVVFSDNEFKMLRNIKSMPDKAHAFFILFILLYAATGVVCFFISNQLLKKKLNLE